MGWGWHTRLRQSAPRCSLLSQQVIGFYLTGNFVGGVHLGRASCAILIFKPKSGSCRTSQSPAPHVTQTLVCRRDWRSTHPVGESAEQFEVMMNKPISPQIEREPPDLG